MSKGKRQRRPQVQKPRLPRPRSVVFQDESHVADKEAARGNEWMTEDLLDEIANWKDFV